MRRRLWSAALMLAGTMTAQLAFVAPVSAAAAPGSGAVAQSGYDRCPPGRVCLFEGWDGTGLWVYATACGYNTVTGSVVDSMVSSVKTDGNAVYLYAYGATEPFGYVPAGTRTNLALNQDNRTAFIWVQC
jgi:hypothetical protein